MSDYKPQRGHRVHVEFDATVVRDDGDGTWLVHPFDSERNFPVFVMPQHMTHLPDPEPEWHEGDVIQFKPHTYIYAPVLDGNPWKGGKGCLSAEAIAEQWSYGNVLPLLRDGKPWAETTQDTP